MKFRQIIDDVSLPSTKSAPHQSRFRSSDEYLKLGQSYLTDCKDEIVDDLVDKENQNEYFDDMYAKDNNDGQFYFVTYSILDFRPHIFQRFIK